MDTKHEKRRTIPIRIGIDTRDQLKEIGVMHETYDDVIKRLIFKKKTGKDKETDFEKKIENLI